MFMIWEVYTMKTTSFLAWSFHVIHINKETLTFSLLDITLYLSKLSFSSTTKKNLYGIS